MKEKKKLKKEVKGSKIKRPGKSKVFLTRSIPLKSWL